MVCGCSNKCHASIWRVTMVLTVLIMIGVCGGIILWQYLPDHQKDTISAIAEGGVQVANTDEDGAPPSNYTFIQCSSSSTTSSLNCCNGIDGLCDVDVDDILFAGIHNAQSSIEDGFFVAPNHQYNVIRALDYGYRTINVDIGICNTNEIVFVHGSCKLGTTDPVITFTQINQWLNKHPNEVILIPIQMVDDLDGVVDLYDLYDMLLRIDGFTQRMYSKVHGEPWPTLRTLVELDQRIILFQYNSKYSCSDILRENVTETTYRCPPGFHDWFTFAGETKFDFLSVDEFDDKSVACNITRGRTFGPFFAVNMFLTVPSKKVQSTIINTKSFIQDHIALCSKVNDGLDVNVVFVDFWSEGNLPEVVQIHNTILAERKQLELNNSTRW